MSNTVGGPTVNTGSVDAASMFTNRFGSSPDLAQLMLATQMDQAQAVDDQVTGQMQDMKQRSDWLKQANAVIGALRTQRPQSSDGSNNYGNVTVNGTSMSVVSWCEANGVSIPHPAEDELAKLGSSHGFINDILRQELESHVNSGKQSDFDAAISNMKDAMDAANSQSQLDMVRLQGLMDKHNNYYQQMTNTLNSNNEVIKNILQKMGS